MLLYALLTKKGISRGFAAVETKWTTNLPRIILPLDAAHELTMFLFSVQEKHEQLNHLEKTKIFQISTATLLLRCSITKIVLLIVFQLIPVDQPTKLKYLKRDCELTDAAVSAHRD